MAEFAKKDPTLWTIADVGSWLDAQDLGDYKKFFKENSVAGAELLELDEDDLLCLGFSKLGYRKRAAAAIDALKQRKRAADGGTSSGVWDASDDELSAASNSLSSTSQSSAASSTSEITIKLQYGKEIRKMKVKPTITFDRFKIKLRREYKSRTHMKWVDADGDQITLSKDSHWSEALAEAKENKNQMKIVITNARSKGPDHKTLKQIENSSQATVVIDPKGKIIGWNDACAKIFGWSRSSIQGLNVKVLMPQHYAEEHDRYLRRYVKGGEPHVVGKTRQVTAVRKSGEEFVAELSLIETKTSGRHYFSGVLRELSAEEQKEEPLPDMQMQFSILQNLLDPCVMADERGKCIFFNKAAETLYGFSAEEVVGQNVKILMPPDMAVKHDAILETYIRTRVKHVIGKGREVTSRNKAGNEFRTKLELSEQHWGKRTVFTAILRPLDAPGAADATAITEKKKTFLASLPVPAVFIDQVGKVLVYNSQAEDLFGFPASEIVGQNVKKLIPPGHIRDNHDSYLEKYKATGKSVNVVGAGRKVQALHRTGALMPVHLAVQVDKEGNNNYYTGIIQASNM